jgi:hypothetical protein
MKALTFESLTKEQQEKLLDTNTFAVKLQEFSKKSTNKLFIYLFGRKEGDWHYQENYLARNNKNILFFFNTLNENEKGIITANIFFNDKLYENR